MATPRGKERREPVFDVAESLDSAPAVRPPDPSEGAGRTKPKASPGPRRKRRKRRRRGGGGGRRTIGRIAYWGAVVGLWLLIAMVGGVVWVGAHLPPIQSLEIPKRPPSIKIVDRQGHLLATRGDMSGPPVPLNELPRYVPQAFVAIEDRRFYSHHGVDPLGIARAAFANMLHRGVSQGGSTITQQLAKNLFLTQERTLTRKMQEVALALWLERKFSKTQILDMYLNRVYFGAGAYGVEAAAQRYFSQAGAEALGRRGRDAGRPCALADAACAKPQPGRRREARADRAGGDGGHEVHHRRHGQGRADRAGACRENREHGLGRLRRRLGDGRARRSGRPGRAGHRGRNHDRAGVAGDGRDRPR